MANTVVIDTNILLKYPEVLNEYDDILLPIAILEELDGLKKAEGELGYQARRAIRLLKQKTDNKEINNIKYEIADYYDMPNDSWDLDKRDNKIIMCAMKNNALLISDDFNVQIKAKSLNIECIGYKKDSDEEKQYKGYKILEINTNIEEDNMLLQQFYTSPQTSKSNILGLYPNQYLIIKDKSIPCYNTNTDEISGYKTIDILKWTGSNYIKIKSPPQNKTVKPLNDLQRCTLDLLCDNSIPIKIIMGTYGSGKTMLSTKVGIHLIEDKGDYGKLFMVRNPVASGAEIGFLPGSKQEKIQDFFKPIVQHFPNGEFQVEQMIKKDKLVMEVPMYMKGLSIGQSFIICDEAEDLDVKTIKLIGSRLEKSSCIVFCGDYKQAEKQFINNNGLMYLSNETKNEPLVGSLVLEMDVRSDASKVFSNL